MKQLFTHFRGTFFKFYARGGTLASSASHLDLYILGYFVYLLVMWKVKCTVFPSPCLWLSRPLLVYNPLLIARTHKQGRASLNRNETSLNLSKGGLKSAGKDNTD